MKLNVSRRALRQRARAAARVPQQFHVGPNRADRRRHLGGNLSRTGFYQHIEASTRILLIQGMRLKTWPRKRS